MELGSRKSKIISELLNSRSHITGQYLASILGVTSRTIRGDIGELNAELAEEGIRILSSAGKGYYIGKKDKDILSKLVAKQSDYIVPIIPDARIDYIIKQLILHPEGISLDTISKQIYVSKSTLDRDLMKVKQRLSEHRTDIIKSSGDICSIAGDEVSVRKLYNISFVKAVKSHSLDKNLLNDEVGEIFNRVKRIIYMLSNQEDADLTGNEFDAAIVFLTVAIFRNKHGFTLNEHDKKITDDNKTIAGVISSVEDEITLNENEKAYIRHYFEKLIFRNSDEDNIDDIKTLIREGIGRVNETFSYCFDYMLEDNILKLLIGSNISSSEHSLDDIKREYPLAVEMAVTLVNFIKREHPIEIYDKILAKIVLLFAGEMEKDLLSKELKKRDIVIICQSGASIKNLIEARIKRHFPGFNILGFFPLYKIDGAIKMNPEIIISTVLVESENIPVIVINPLFKDYDIFNINTVIRQIEHRECISYEFLNLFKENLFIKDIDARDKYEAIKILSDVLNENGYAQDGFYQAVVERENISSTAIGNMVSVPHAVGNDLGENVVAIGILKKPIDWGQDKVQLVFVINIKNAADGNVKQIFKSFFELISSADKVARIIKSRNYYEFLKAINRWEGTDGF